MSSWTMVPGSGISCLANGSQRPFKPGVQMAPELSYSCKGSCVLAVTAAT